MNYDMNRPWGPEMNDGADPRRLGREGRRGGRRGDRNFEGGRPDEQPGGFGPEGFGPEGPRRGHGRGRGREGFGPGFGPRAFGSGFAPEGPGFGPGPFHGPGRRGGGRARRGDVRLAVLALLAEAPANGYQIIQALDERTSGLWKPSPGAIYPALSQLEDEGLIAPDTRDGQKVFTLTEAGQKAAAEVDPKPWETVNSEFGPKDAEGAASFWKEFGTLALAAKSVAASGSPEQLKAATEAIQATKRKLYGLLAEEPQA